MKGEKDRYMYVSMVNNIKNLSIIQSWRKFPLTNGAVFNLRELTS